MLEINMGKSNGLRDMGSGGFLQGIRGQRKSAQQLHLPEAAGPRGFNEDTQAASTQPRTCRLPTAPFC